MAVPSYSADDRIDDHKPDVADALHRRNKLNEIAGRVERILFREGERVSQGDVLVKLDDSVQQADLDRAKANLTLAKSKQARY